MRQVWVALAAAQHKAGLVQTEQLADLKTHQLDIDIDRSSEIERSIRHDVMAELRTFAEQCPVGGGIIHWGATSADITDNVDVLRIREACWLIEGQLRTLLSHFAERVEATAKVPIIGLTHIQPAEPTTLGYRLAVYGQDLLENLIRLRSMANSLRGKGFKGAVGTQASYQELLQGSGMSPGEMEREAMALLDLPYFTITTQTYPRSQDLRVLHILAEIAAVLHKFALDFRLLQSPLFGEWAEPFGEKQVGSSAMPFKRNPIITENICSLARIVSGLTAVAWNNASQAILERSLDDSANRRLFLAEAFLVVDELLLKGTRVLAGMRLDERAMRRNLAHYGPFAATERVLVAMVAAGADRQEAHEWLREASLLAWEAVQSGEYNPLVELLVAHEQMGQFLTAEQIRALMSADSYLGSAAERALDFARLLKEEIS